MSREVENTSKRDTARRRPRRHPAEVTADRLGDHLDRWFDSTNGPMRDAISKVRDWLDQRAQETER